MPFTRNAQKAESQQVRFYCSRLCFSVIIAIKRLSMLDRIRMDVLFGFYRGVYFKFAEKYSAKENMKLLLQAGLFLMGFGQNSFLKISPEQEHPCSYFQHKTSFLR